MTLAAANPAEFNRLGLDYRRALPRPKVRGAVIDAHTHLLAARHARAWFESADHYGIDYFWTMSPLEEAAAIQRQWGHRVMFIAVPRWREASVDEWLRRIEAFANLGSRVCKFHMAPSSVAERGWRFDSPQIRRVMRHAADLGMILMSHVGDPELWYARKYTDTARFGTRDDHYADWETALSEHRDRPWLGAHLGGNPEDLSRLQRLFDTYPNLHLDCSATRWMVREVGSRRDATREFFIRNQDRLLFGSDQVSLDDRGFDFLSSRFWSHRKLWETAYSGDCPILDPDLPPDAQPALNGLALPDEVLQKLYHDNAARLMRWAGVRVPDVDEVRGRAAQ